MSSRTELCNREYGDYECSCCPLQDICVAVHEQLQGMEDVGKRQAMTEFELSTNTCNITVSKTASPLSLAMYMELLFPLLVQYCLYVQIWIRLGNNEG